MIRSFAVLAACSSFSTCLLVEERAGTVEGASALMRRQSSLAEVDNSTSAELADDDQQAEVTKALDEASNDLDEMGKSTLSTLSLPADEEHKHFQKFKFHRFHHTKTTQPIDKNEQHVDLAAAQGDVDALTKLAAKLKEQRSALPPKGQAIHQDDDASAAANGDESALKKLLDKMKTERGATASAGSTALTEVSASKNTVHKYISPHVSPSPSQLKAAKEDETAAESGDLDALDRLASALVANGKAATSELQAASDGQVEPGDKDQKSESPTFSSSDDASQEDAGADDLDAFDLSHTKPRDRRKTPKINEAERDAQLQPLSTDKAEDQSDTDKWNVVGKKIQGMAGSKPHTQHEGHEKTSASQKVAGTNNSPAKPKINDSEVKDETSQQPSQDQASPKEQKQQSNSHTHEKTREPSQQSKEQASEKKDEDSEQSSKSKPSKTKSSKVARKSTGMHSTKVEANGKTPIKPITPTNIAKVKITKQTAIDSTAARPTKPIMKPSSGEPGTTKESVGDSVRTSGHKKQQTVTVGNQDSQIIQNSSVKPANTTDDEVEASSGQEKQQRVEVGNQDSQIMQNSSVTQDDTTDDEDSQIMQNSSVKHDDTTDDEVEVPTTDDEVEVPSGPKLAKAKDKKRVQTPHAVAAAGHSAGVVQQSSAKEAASDMAEEVSRLVAKQLSDMNLVPRQSAPDASSTENGRSIVLQKLASRGKQTVDSVRASADSSHVTIPSSPDIASDDPFKTISDNQAAAQKIIESMNKPVVKSNPEWEAVMKEAALANASLNLSGVKDKAEDDEDTDASKPDLVEKPVRLSGRNKQVDSSSDHREVLNEPTAKERLLEAMGASPSSTALHPHAAIGVNSIAQTANTQQTSIAQTTNDRQSSAGGEASDSAAARLLQAIKANPALEDMAPSDDSEDNNEAETAASRLSEIMAAAPSSPQLPASSQQLPAPSSPQLPASISQQLPAGSSPPADAPTAAQLLASITNNDRPSAADMLQNALQAQAGRRISA